MLLFKIIRCLLFAFTFYPDVKSLYQVIKNRILMYHICSNKHQTSNEGRSAINAAHFHTQVKITAAL